MAQIALFLFALDQFRNKTMDSQRFVVSFSLSFSLRTKIGLLDRRMLLVVVRAQGIIGGSLIVVSCCPGILSERVGRSN